ncbi:uroporphyrinogen-III C-methyltransferase [Marinomonas pontica]|uniref:uroporphyrinogen-III C-methyltransferase n=1 Tax=Marinomonas pontica TaxID=264739 RepID=UPI002243DB91|nr:uroporphyrinogen-III C-methyltransferase [Marinomonas pontica]MCW8356258.1 uroporphyrinogen-III C-methyltransferase [Marinomonas pontica]
MTENNKQELNLNDAKETSPVPPQNNQDTKSGTPIVAALSIGISAIALATSGWLYFQSTQNTAEKDIAALTIQQAALNKKLDSDVSNKDQLKQLIAQVQSAEQSIQTQKEHITTQQTRQTEKIQSLESKLNRLNNTTKEDWKLAEAEYLIRLANQRLLLESDNNGAVTLLVNADDILNELEDPIAFATRKALAKDIQALKSISSFDLEGAYLKLNALYNDVANLPQREPSKEWQANNANTETQISDASTNRFTTALESFWRSIRSLIVINYNHKPIKALLPPAEYQQLITGLQLQIDVAQVALVKGEPVIYQQALSRIATATTEHFETQSKNVVSFLASLTALQQLNPSPDLPLPRESLMAMKALMKEWNNRDVKTSTTIEQNDTDTTAPDQQSTTETQIEPGDQA